MANLLLILIILRWLPKLLICFLLFLLHYFLSSSFHVLRHMRSFFSYVNLFPLYLLTNSLLFFFLSIFSPLFIQSFLTWLYFTCDGQLLPLHLNLSVNTRGSPRQDKQSSSLMRWIGYLVKKPARSLTIAKIADCWSSSCRLLFFYPISIGDDISTWESASINVCGRRWILDDGGSDVIKLFSEGKNKIDSPAFLFPWWVIRKRQEMSNSGFFFH